MPRKVNISQEPMGAQMKIRSYIMNLIFRSEGEAMKIPSLNILSPQLDVARSTLQLAIKQLIEEGYLVTRVGIGTFTNPKIRFHGGHTTQKAIGLLTGDGKYVYFSYYIWLLQAAVGNKLVHRCNLAHPVLLNSYSDQAVFDEIDAKGLDGLVWITPPAERDNVIQAISKKIPLVVLDRPVKNVNSFWMDAGDNGWKIGMRLLAENRMIPAFSPCLHQNQEKLKGILTALKGNGANVRTSFFGKSDFRQMESAMASGTLPDAIVFNPEETNEVTALARKYCGPDCLLVSCFFRQEGAKERMLVHPLSLDTYAARAIECLWKIMDNPGMSCRHECIKNDAEFYIAK